MKNLNSNFFNGFLVLEENYYREFSVKLHVLQRKHLNIYLKNTSRFQKILSITQYEGQIQLSYETFPSFFFSILTKLQAKKRFCLLKISATVPSRIFHFHEKWTLYFDLFCPNYIAWCTSIKLHILKIIQLHFFKTPTFFLQRNFLQLIL